MTRFIHEYRKSKAEWSFANEPMHKGSLDLPPALNKMHCRDCGKPVPSNAATCPHCNGGAK